MDEAGGEEMATAMCAIWAEVLGTPVEADDDFFAIGGDSLAAVQIEALAGERLGLLVDSTDLLLAATPRLLVTEALTGSPDAGFG